MGIAWDGDFDRCFLFDEKGEFVEGYYIVGLLEKSFLDKDSCSKIIFDPRVYWNTQDIIETAEACQLRVKPVTPLSKNVCVPMTQSTVVKWVPSTTLEILPIVTRA
jgi:phosphomannomutase